MSQQFIHDVQRFNDLPPSLDKRCGGGVLCANPLPFNRSTDQLFHTPMRGAEWAHPERILIELVKEFSHSHDEDASREVLQPCLPGQAHIDVSCQYATNQHCHGGHAGYPKNIHRGSCGQGMKAHGCCKCLGKWTGVHLVLQVPPGMFIMRYPPHTPPTRWRTRWTSSDLERQT